MNEWNRKAGIELLGQLKKHFIAELFMRHFPFFGVLLVIFGYFFCTISRYFFVHYFEDTFLCTILRVLFVHIFLYLQLNRMSLQVETVGVRVTLARCCRAI